MQDFNVVTEKELYKILQSLNNKKGSPDGITGNMIKNRMKGNVLQKFELATVVPSPKVKNAKFPKIFRSVNML